MSVSVQGAQQWRGRARTLRTALGLLLPVLLAVLLCLPAVSQARERDDHERARQAVAAGQILPLKAILARAEREAPGDVLEVELEQSDSGTWLYELKVLQAGGVLTKLKLDARTGAVLKSRSRGRDRDRERERD